MGGENLARKASEVVDFFKGNSELPPMEAAVIQKYSGFIAITEKDKKGNPLVYYVGSVPDPNKPGKFLSQKYDIFSYKVIIFKEQLNALQLKLAPLQRAAGTYRSAKIAIEKYIEGKKSDYRRMEMRILSQRDIADNLQADYDRKIGRDFEVGDRAEIALKQAIVQARAKVPSLDDYDTFVYYGQVARVLEPGRPFEGDLRDLVSEYDQKIDDLEGGVMSKVSEDKISPIKDRIHAYQGGLAKAETEWRATRSIVP